MHLARRLVHEGASVTVIETDPKLVQEADSFYEIDISSKNPLHSQSRYEQYELTI